MIGLLVVGLVAGVIAGISPCVLPVLPVLFVAGAAEGGDRPDARNRARRRAVTVVAGIVVSFTVLTLAGSAILSALGLPEDLLRDLGIAVLALLGIGLVFPALGERAEAFFARLHVPAPRTGLGAFILGLSTGAVFVPCAGPVLAAISVLGATRHVGLETVALAVSFSLGAAIPLLLVALAGDSIVRRVAFLRTHTPRVRLAGGIVLIAMALAIGFNWTAPLQRVVPGYTTSLQNGVENSTFARHQLQALRGEHAQPSTALLQACIPEEPVLENCGPTPAFRGIAAWLNTPGHRAQTISGDRGKVVLVDFWTYSCINCQRELPHVEGWYRRYHADGFDVVGVSTPEFAFEHVISNVAAATHQLGVTYPVAIDNDDATWNAYLNEYWPASYLINANGVISHIDYGEGDYSQTEALIRAELIAADPRVHLPAPTDLADLTPTEQTTPESYLGYQRLDNLAGVTSVAENSPATYHFPSSLEANMLALGGVWTIGPQAVTAGADARLELNFEAAHVYLVLGGHGALTVRLGNGAPRTIRISGIPRLYTLWSSDAPRSGILELAATPGVVAYDFTFG